MRITAIFAVLAMATGGASAQQFDTPSDLLRTLYLSYISGVEIHDFSAYFSDDLTQELNGQRIGQAELRALGVDPITGGKDWQISSFEIHPLSEDGRSADVDVSFVNFRQPVSLRFELVWERVHGWQIDHISGRAGDVEWCTRDVISLTQTSP